MPNDSMFTEAPEEKPTETQETKEETSGGLTAADVQAMLDSQAAKFQATNDTLQAELSDLKTAASRPTPVPSKTPQTSDEFIEDFTNDAPGTIRSTAKEAINEELAPVRQWMSQTHDTLHEGLMSAEQQKIETEFGPEAWNTHFKPILDTRMKTIRENNVMGLADANVIRNEVLGVKGLKMNELVALKETNTKAVVDAKETERTELLAGFNMGGMTGGTNVPAKPVDAPLTDVETAYVRSKEEAGMTVDIKRLRRIQAKGSSSLEENLSAMEASK